MKLEKLKKKELDEYCERIGIEIKNKKKIELIQAVYDHDRAIIDQAIKDGNCLNLLRSKINALADEYASNLDQKIVSRKEEMKKDDNSHYLIYRVLGISYEEGFLIDEYQNTGRFLYKYAGSFLEEAASM
ncbi:ApaLI-like restriction endonuclease [Candidatus Electrothrix marina]|uniref:ApaLI-like restriction endonuclease n=1 Tax=Candidatus Electrothrix marina TaxID=1859130 RepID=A0A444JEK6_9BACT|nr:ApaLI-like restriction endonuclease [Candidatus Electrothrix marina]